MRRALVTTLLALTTTAHALVLTPDAQQPGPDTQAFLQSLESPALQNELSGIVNLIQKGRWDTAQQQLGDYLRQHPTDPKALSIAGTLLLQKKQYKEAQVAFEAALKTNPRQPDLLTRLGVTRMLMGDLNKGARILQFSLQQQPGQLLALRYLAWYADRIGQPRQKRTLLEQVVALQPPDQLTEAVLELAGTYDDLQQYPELYRLLKSRVQTDSPELAHYYFALGAALSGHGTEAASSIDRVRTPELRTLLNIAWALGQQDIDKATAALTKGEKASGIRKTLLWANAARPFAYTGHYDTAARLLEKTLKSVAMSAQWQSGRALIRDLAALYLSNGRVLDALSLYERYAKRYGALPGYRFEQAEALITAGQLDQAQSVLSNSLDADDPQAHYLEGIIQRRKGNPLDAVKAFEASLKAHPVQENGWVQLAGAWFDAGKYDEALKALQDGLTAMPGSHLLAFEYASMLEQTGKPEQAIAAYQQILRVYPDDVAALDNLAALLIEAGKPDEAITYAQRAFRLAPVDPMLKFGLARAYLESGRKQEGIPLMKAVIGDKRLPANARQIAENLLATP